MTVSQILFSSLQCLRACNKNVFLRCIKDNCHTGRAAEDRQCRYGRCADEYHLCRAHCLMVEPDTPFGEPSTPLPLSTHMLNTSGNELRESSTKTIETDLPINSLPVEQISRHIRCLRTVASILPEQSWNL